ncbi:hypothetical protein V5O48_004393 [Marasmius crinis-equi]|uniref:Actin cortical patch SUR7/pH-response regulator PalI n=1 Tax=Marasmius crinis-equi TaxID=585013 RepID=A0ABR3FQ89_9AGAR
MRGEIFVGFATFLSLASVIILIFAHVGQISTSKVPHSIYMAKVNTSGYGDALTSAFLNPIFGLYTSNASAPLSTRAGLRQVYEFGFYSHCAYVNDTAGICSNSSTAHPYRPYEYLTQDMAANYSTLTDAIILGIPFRDSNSLGQKSKAGYYLILLGTIAAALALLTGVLKYSFTFMISTVSAALSSLFLLIGAALWTVAVTKSNSINNFRIGPDNNRVSLGFTVSIGPALYLVWASFVCMFVSLVPYMIS